MKKTNEELLQFFGLKIGDKVKIKGFTKSFVIVEEYGKIFAKRENCLSSWDYYDIGKLADVLLICDYEVIKPKKKVGELICDEEMICINCPLKAISCSYNNDTLYEQLEKYIEDLNSFSSPLKPFEKAFIDALKVELKVELDKEVEVEWLN